MARDRSRRPEQPMVPPPAQPATLQLGLGYDPKGKMEQRDVVSSKDGWSEYKLNDGATIRLKAVLVDAKKAINQFNPEGDPIYVMQQTIVTSLEVPEALKKPE
jgi:hypothetical protein